MVTAQVRELLKTTTIETLVSKSLHKDMIVIDSQASIKEACATLSMNKISSAPVYEHETGDLLGVLDYSDLVTYVLQVLHKIPKEQALEADISMVSQPSLADNPLGVCILERNGVG